MSKSLYESQDKLLSKVFSLAGGLSIPGVILCGGTSLARYYLNHRISYDLDFFVPERFSPDRLSIELGKHGIMLENIHIGEDKYATQLHASAVIDGERIKLSFIEDIYADMWKRVSFGDIVTEEIGGLYHRKLRTISGSGYVDGSTQGARQTARDIFDVYVLNKTIMPVSEFVSEANALGANFPSNDFAANLINMPWIDLLSEFELLDISIDYKDVSFIGEIKVDLVSEAMKIAGRFKYGPG